MVDSDDDFEFHDDPLLISSQPPVFSSDDDSDELPSVKRTPLQLASTSIKEKREENGGSFKPSKKRTQSTRERLAEVTKRISEIDKLRDVDNKCSDLLGNKNVLEQTEKIIKNHEERKSTSEPPITPLCDQSTVMGPQGATLSLLPDLKVFVNPIEYIETLDPPVALKDCKALSFLPEGTINNAQGLRDLINNKLLLLVFRSEPCPHEILFWLLEVSCLSKDVLTRASAFTILVQLLQNTGLIIEIGLHSICLPRIITLLVKLGATEDGLKTFTYTPSVKEEKEEIMHTEVDAVNLQFAIKNMTSFITIVCHINKDNFNNQEQYVSILLKLAMDSNTCQSLVSSYVSNCLNEVMMSVDSEEFDKINEVFSSAMSVYTSAGAYHYCVYLLQLIPVTNIQHRNLQRRLMKLILKSVSNMTEDASDQQVVQSVIEHYLRFDTNSLNYKELYAVMTTLAMFLKKPDMKWTSPESKTAFLDDLGCLGTKKIKENIAQAAEKGVVKDLIIRTKLDLEQETRETSKQTNLFDFFIDQSLSQDD